ncbi:MAG: hypothetical protein JXX29_02745, partial [Deltaproteobacteria bacterium]|nr:hypothetical protein [Deltaproteobacteria bacterium]
TIQQYLTPGDISIQAVGVAPDILFLPTVVDKKDLLISEREREFSEASLDSHLIRASTIERGDRPGAMQMPYFVSAKQRKADLEMFKQCYSDDPDRKPYRGRFELEFARRLIVEATGVTTAELLGTAQQMIAQMASSEKKDVQAALKALGVDWSAAGEKTNINEEEMVPSEELKATARVDAPGKAGEDFKLTVTVKNTGKEAVHLLRGKTTSDNPYLSDVDLVFGMVKPGQTKRWTATVSIPPVVSSRIDPVEVSFFSAEGKVPAPVSVDAEIVGRKEPELVYEWTLEDHGNGNGFMEPGEKFTMHVTVTNKGEGDTFKTEVNLSSKPGLDVESGRFVMEPLKPGRSASGSFEILVPTPQENAVAADSQNVDVLLTFDEWVPLRMPSLVTLQQQTLMLKVSKPRAAAEKAEGTVTASENGTLVYATPSSDGRVIGTAASGASFKTDATVDGYFRVALSNQHQGWVASKKVIPGGKGDGEIAARMTQLPVVRIDGAASQVVNGKSLILKGTAAHPEGLRDVLVFVGGKKVEYEQVPDKNASYSFAFTVPLETGANMISVVARHSNHSVASRNIFIRRVE